MDTQHDLKHQLEEAQHLLESRERDLALAAELGKALLDKNKELEETIEKLKLQNAQLEQTREIEASTHEQLNKLLDENNRLKNKITVLEYQKTQLEAEITLIKTQKEELLLQNSELQDQIKKVQQQLQTLQKEMSSSSLKETIHKLNEQLENSKEIITQLKKKDIEQQQQIEQLRSELENQKNLSKTRSFSISSSLEEENAALKVKIESLESKLKTLQNQQDLQEIRDLIQTNEQLLKEVTRLRRENEIMTRQQQETQQLLNDAKSALATMAMIEKEQESISTTLAEELNQHPIDTGGHNSSEISSNVGDVDKDSTASTSTTVILQRREQKQKELIEEQQRLLELFTKKIEEADSLLQQRYTELDQKLREDTLLKKIPPSSGYRKEGYLVKQGRVVKNWKRRFFFVESNCLYYSPSIKDRYNTKGMIPLEGAQISEVNIPQKQHAFQIKTKDRTFYLVADTAELQREWIESLSEIVREIDSSTKSKSTLVLKTSSQQ